MQMNVIANHKAFKDIYGVTFWCSLSTKPEILEWFGCLVRHYCINGNKSMLSEKYGYNLKLAYLKNPDFSAGLDNWKIIPASPGSIEVRNIKQFSFKRCYYPRNSNLLVMKKITGKVNRIEQEIVGLKPGKLYSLQVQAGSPEVAGMVKVDYNLNVKIKDVKILKTEKRIIRGDGSTNKICRNAIEIVFTALKQKALLTIADGISKPDCPELKEIFLDSIKVQPFYSSKINK
jgi:hypothetical protein